MRENVTERANAKINLFLEVTSRRPDGYHIIDGIMQSVTLADTVTVSWEPSDRTEVTLRAPGAAPGMPTDMTNLACRAAAGFLASAGRTGIVEILLEKRIPMAAGLAGGSSDAAAVLRALNRLTGTPLTDGELCAVASGLGADVPFCVRGGAMRTQGIGELLTPVPCLSGCRVVIACAGEGVSTPWAYRRLDELYADFRVPRAVDAGVNALIRVLREQDPVRAAGEMRNLFEEAVVPERPFVARIRERMIRCGAIRAMMSGSGPSVFGIFQKEDDGAENTVRALTDEGIPAWLCVPAAEELSGS